MSAFIRTKQQRIAETIHVPSMQPPPAEHSSSAPEAAATAELQNACPLLRACDRLIKHVRRRDFKRAGLHGHGDALGTLPTS